MKYYNSVINSQAFISIKQDILSNRLAHAYLLVSSDEELIRTFFCLTACLIYCKNGMCLECFDCRKVINNNHADIVSIVPEEGKQLKVGDISRMMNTLYTGAMEERGVKLYLMYSGERMNTATQNKLLKTLEEPPRGVTVIIASSGEGALLDTIRSRVRKLYIDSLSACDILEELNKEYPLRKDNIDIAKASAGSMTLAKRLIEDAHYKKLYDDVYMLLNTLTRSAEIIDWLNHELFLKDNIEDTLRLMHLALRDVNARIQSRDVFAVNKLKELDIIKDNYSLEAVIGAQEAVDEALMKLMSNCNPINIADNLLFKILEVRHICRK